MDFVVIGSFSFEVYFLSICCKGLFAYYMVIVIASWCRDYICIFYHFLFHFIGMLAAEAAFGAVHEGVNMETYWDSLKNSWVWEELRRARNYRPVSKSVHHFFSIMSPTYITPRSRKISFFFSLNLLNNLSWYHGTTFVQIFFPLSCRHLSMDLFPAWL